MGPSSALARTFAACQELHKCTEGMVREAYALIQASATAVVEHGAEPTELCLQAVALGAPIATALAVQQDSDALLHQVEGLLRRAEQGGPNLSRYEKKLFGDRLEEYEQNARPVSEALEQHIESLRQTLKHLAPEVLNGHQEEQEGVDWGTGSRAEAAAWRSTALGPDLRPGPAETPGGALFAPLRHNTLAQRLAVALYTMSAFPFPAEVEKPPKLPAQPPVQAGRGTGGAEPPLRLIGAYRRGPIPPGRQRGPA
ncbi:hypothetical protein [Pseudomonas sp. TH31]|uniref:hypothetical protein n=1 Tax=Pseudomonas sp. TH31 TaxID=2796396 RepID=UPI001912EDCC|nr:hypothetical protein [Pseudomonas sp. TH31]MBK5415432.1 hypothetical protein [Pseudomonas sp. TH31]